MKRIIFLAVVLVLLAAGWTGAWFWASGYATTYVRSLADADGVTTPKVTCGSLSMGGFPFGFDMTCTKATVTLADTTVSLNGLKASADVYDPLHVLVFAQSPVNIADAFTGSQSRLDFTDAQASARLEGWRIGRVSLVVDKPVWNDTVLEDRLLGTADKLEAHLVDIAKEHDGKAGQQTLGEFAEITALAVPGYQVGNGHATFEGKITKLPDDVRTYDADLLKRWQTNGGVFELVGLKGDDADTHVDATGHFQLDAGGHVNGQLKLSSKGVVERVGSLVPPQMQGLVFGSPAPDGTYNQTINIAGGLMFAGLVPVGMLQPLF